MKLPRPAYDPGAMLGFYEEALDALGAVCERTWHDRLQVIAEGRAARLWNPEGALHEVELRFVAPEAGGARDGATEVFPGCPLTFRLAELLPPQPLPLDRVVLAVTDPRPPAPDVGARLWRTQFPHCSGCHFAGAPVRAHHFALLFLARCEIQAIDQHWSLLRLAVSLADGSSDEALAAGFDLVGTDINPPGIEWPATDIEVWSGWIRRTLEAALAPELAGIRERQRRYLERELNRVDDYFEQYERELETRRRRRSAGEQRLKLEERQAAARAEHGRRRDDQIARHAIRVVPHLDALVLVAEPAWRVPLRVEEDHRLRTLERLFVPRARRWVVTETNPTGQVVPLPGSDATV